MRILALTNLYPNPYQPHRATYNRQQFRALATEHDVQVIAPIAWTGEWSARRRTKQQLLNEDRKRLCDGMVIHHPRYAFTPKMLRGWYGQFLVQSIRSCFHEAVREFRPDIVLGSWAYPDGWAAVRLAREAGLPVAIKVHGSDLLSLDEHPAKLKRTTQALKSADAVITVSQHLAGRAIEMDIDPSRVHVIYNGVDRSVFHPVPRETARQQLSLTSSDPLILFVGNLVPVKGLDVLINALTTLVKTGQRFECVMVGDGPLKAELQTQIDASGLTERVRMIGARPLEELPLWYQSANLVVLPSWSEGVPNVLLEAAACGTPFVASNVGGIPEIAPSDALVTPGDSTSLAERIGAFLDSSHRSTSDSTFHTRSWNESASAMANVLRSVVTAHTARTPMAG